MNVDSQIQREQMIKYSHECWNGVELMVRKMDDVFQVFFIPASCTEMSLLGQFTKLELAIEEAEEHVKIVESKNPEKI